jgi:hypothetical protein
MKLRCVLLFVLFATMVSLTSMAYASPPDPVWVEGYFDDGDFDDVVVFLTSAGATLDLFPLDNLELFLVLVTSLRSPAEGHATARQAAPTEARAPPAS